MKMTKAQIQKLLKSKVVFFSSDGEVGLLNGLSFSIITYPPKNQKASDENVLQYCRRNFHPRLLFTDKRNYGYRVKLQFFHGDRLTPARINKIKSQIAARFPKTVFSVSNGKSSSPYFRDDIYICCKQKPSLCTK